MQAFHVIAPSIPGFAFSSAPKQKGFGLKEIAKTFNQLMLELGYSKYVAQGKCSHPEGSGFTLSQALFSCRAGKRVPALLWFQAHVEVHRAAGKVGIVVGNICCRCTSDTVKTCDDDTAARCEPST